MLLSDAILHHNSPLAKVWLAAHYDRKLSKRDYVHVSIATTVTQIITSAGHDPRLLRLSGPLLLGVTKIYAKKAKYLLDTANDAKLNIILAFNPRSTANRHQLIKPANQASLTLTETVSELDLLLVPNISKPDWAFTKYQPRPVARNEDITLADPGMFNTSSRNLFSVDSSMNDIPMLDLGLDLGLDSLDIEVGRRDRTVEPTESFLDTVDPVLGKVDIPPLDDLTANGLEPFEDLPPLDDPVVVQKSHVPEPVHLLFEDSLQAISTFNASIKKRRYMYDANPELDHLTLQRLVTDPSDLLTERMATIPRSRALFARKQQGTYERIMRKGIFSNFDSSDLVCAQVSSLMSQTKRARLSSANMDVVETKVSEDLDLPVVSDEFNPDTTALMDENYHLGMDDKVYEDGSMLSNGFLSTNGPSGGSPSHLMNDSFAYDVTEEPVPVAEETGVDAGACSTLKHLKSKLSVGSSTSVNVMEQMLTRTTSRAAAARTFYELLLLGSRNYVTLAQPGAAYTDIHVQLNQSAMDTSV